jgi:RNA polymerase sigma-70 factor (ECF subfamily)
VSVGPSQIEDRFEAMYHRTAPDILSYLVRRLPTREDAADLLADVYLVAWRRWHDVPAPPEDRLWLFGVARRTLLAKRRSEFRRHEAADALRQTLRTPAHDTVAPEVDAQAAAIHDALAQLSPTDRDLVTLTLWDGLTSAEVATVLCIKEGAARVRLHRARARLRALIDSGESTIVDTAKLPSPRPQT